MLSTQGVNTMHNIYNIISDIDILNNETKRMNCPECGGYKTFTISNKTVVELLQGFLQY